MGEITTKHIWNPLTGITDIEADLQELSASEISGIRSVWRDQRERLGADRLSDFTERLSREWAIETGIIEGLYEIDRGVTQTLIERGFQAELLSHGSTNRPREFVLQLLRDQKETLDGVFDFVKENRDLSSSYIKELHSALLRSQTTTEGVDLLGRNVEVTLIKGNWKKQPNSPVRDGVTYEYCPPEHVVAEMDRLIALHAKHIANRAPVEVQAAWLHHRFTQIHPFQDGNGRIARAITSLVLVKDGLFPLVVTRDDRTSYLEALEFADGGNLKPLVDLIAKLQRVQFAKATAISEALLSEEAEVDTILGGLLKAAEKTAAERKKDFEEVFERADEVIKDLSEGLHSIAPEVTNALQRIVNSGEAFVTTSEESTSHYYRAQIFENAKYHLHYFVDFSEFRSWVALNMKWVRRARLVFAIHGIGRQFNGSLICAPFLEFRDKDEDEDVRSTFVPVAQEGFVFFHNEKADAILTRFQPWRKRVLQVALKELIQNL